MHVVIYLARPSVGWVHTWCWAGSEAGDTASVGKVVRIWRQVPAGGRLHDLAVQGWVSRAHVLE